MSLFRKCSAEVTNGLCFRLEIQLIAKVPYLMSLFAVNVAGWLLWQEGETVLISEPNPHCDISLPTPIYLMPIKIVPADPISRLQ